MATEQCPICGDHVPFSNTVHVMLNTRDDAGVTDFYVCRSCHEAELEPLFADAMAVAAADGEATEGEGAGGEETGEDETDEAEVEGDESDGETDDGATAGSDGAAPDPSGSAE